MKIRYTIKQDTREKVDGFAIGDWVVLNELGKNILGSITAFDGIMKIESFIRSQNQTDIYLVPKSRGGVHQLTKYFRHATIDEIKQAEEHENQV